MQELAAQLRAYYAQARYDQATVLLQQLAALGDRSAVRWQYALLLAGVRGDADAAIEAIHQLQALGDPLLVKALRVAWHHAVAAQHSELATLLAQTGWQLAPDDINFRLLNLFDALKSGDPQGDRVKQLTEAPLPLTELSTEVLDQLIAALRDAGLTHDAVRLLDWRARKRAPDGEEDVEKLAILALTLKRFHLVKSLTTGFINRRLRYLQSLADVMLLDWQALQRSQLSPAELHDLLAADPLWVPPSHWTTLMLPSYTDAEHLALARRAAPKVTLEQMSAHVRPLQRPKRLCVGYLSGDFKVDPTSQMFCPVLQAHDRTRFTWVGVDNSRDDKSTRRQTVLAAFDAVIPAQNLTAPALAQAIRTAGIDILVDLSGHTADNRLDVLALRPAPIQMEWLGFPGGLSEQLVDYLVTDGTAVPVGAEVHFGEAVLRLPGAYLPGGEYPRVIEPPARITQGLPDSALVLACFNQHVKISRETFDLWCEMLVQLPDSVLWLLDQGQGAQSRQTLEIAAQQRGVTRSRLIWATWLPHADHVQRIACADLVLDTHPCTMHTTAVDTLAAGVPFLAFGGATLASRVSSSLLKAAGLGDCVCSDVTEYRSRIVELATNAEKRQQLRARFEAARLRSALFDNKLFAANLESVYDEVYLRWQNNRGQTTVI